MRQKRVLIEIATDPWLYATETLMQSAPKGSLWGWRRKIYRFLLLSRIMLLRVLCAGMILPQIGVLGNTVFAPFITTLLPPTFILNFLTLVSVMLSAVFGLLVSRFSTYQSRASVRQEILTTYIEQHPAMWLEYERNSRYSVIQ